MDENISLGLYFQSLNKALARYISQNSINFGFANTVAIAAMPAGTKTKIKLPTKQASKQGYESQLFGSYSIGYYIAQVYITTKEAAGV